MGEKNYTTDDAFRLLVITGYYSKHENLDLLRSRFSPYEDGELLDDIHQLSQSGDLNYSRRVNLTHLLSVAIDPDNSEEIDDALSVKMMEDERIKVWIHIADPTSLIRFGSRIDCAARERGQTIYLPTCTSYMYPRRVAMDMISFKANEECKSVSVSVTINKDGSFNIEDCFIELSTIKPLLISYDHADSLLSSSVTEESINRVMHLLSVASGWRRTYRTSVMQQRKGNSGERKKMKYTLLSNGEFDQIAIKVSI